MGKILLYQQKFRSQKQQYIGVFIFMLFGTCLQNFIASKHEAKVHEHSFLIRPGIFKTAVHVNVLKSLTKEPLYLIH